jgi:hypothetical protein
MTDFIMSIVPLWRQEYKLRCKEMCEVCSCYILRCHLSQFRAILACVKIHMHRFWNPPFYFFKPCN